MKLNTLNNNRVKVLAAATGFAVAALLAGPAKAATDTATFNVKMTITNTCDVSTTAPTDLDFGSHPSSATNIAVSSTVTLTCTNGANYKVGLLPQNTGATANGTGKMDGTAVPANTIAYSLWQDSAHTTAWGNTGGTNTNDGTGTGSPVALTVYGLVASANVPADDYKDVVNVTVTY